ncbi:MAG TPA: hypothetical protein VG326_01900 [Tepidisphaeraceae bacterium]|jgi:hypothetical protein|nr:hypothetical protein [Tepidisphaeraceae bacterium]
MRYTGLLFYPPGAKLTINQDDLSPIQGKTAYRLYAQFKKEMTGEEFEARVDTGGLTEPILLRFRRVGQTAAYAAFARAEHGAAEKLDAVVAFMSGLDAEEDKRVLEKLRAAPSLRMIPTDDWTNADQTDGPMSAAFFTSEHSLNNPILHGLMSLAGAAFLDCLGLLD